MNKTSIEWTDYTWNPVTGCFHSCRNTYCYNTKKSTSPLNRFGASYIENGKRIYEKEWDRRETGQCHIADEGEIYPYGYDPTFYPHRLNEPVRLRNASKIFVVDTGDLFGQWVPAEWINQVIEITNKCPQHTFQYLTKNPKRLMEYKFPDNAWAGTSVNSDEDIERADILKTVKSQIRYLSIEPLLGPITFSLDGLQWIILGAETGRNPIKPERGWIEEILKQTKVLNIPVFMKNNIRRYSNEFYQKFPK